MCFKCLNQHIKLRIMTGVMEMLHKIYNIVHIIYILCSDLLACSTVWTLCLQQTWQLLRTALSIPLSFLPSSPQHSSPTGRTSGPQPDLPSATLLPSLPPSSVLLFLHAGIHSDTEQRIQVIHHWLPIWARDLLRLMMHTVWSPEAQG